MYNKSYQQQNYLIKGNNLLKLLMNELSIKKMIVGKIYILP